MIQERTAGPLSDRKQQIVFIGTIDRDEAAIRAELDGMLVELPREGRIDTKSLASLPDPFPAWQKQEE